MQAAEDTSTKRAREAPIGVFDSGVGGLTVLRALLERLPQRRLRLPRRHGAPAVRHQEPGVDPAILAAGSATAARARREMPRRRVQHGIGHRARCADAGVRARAGARRARAGRGGSVPRNATRPHRRARHGEHRAWRRLPGRDCATPAARGRYGARVSAVRGAGRGGLDRGARRRRRDPPLPRRRVRRRRGRTRIPIRLLLGCTHFPVLAPALARVLGPGDRDRRFRGDHGGLAGEVLEQRGLARSDQPQGRVTLLATDGAERFARVGAVFLGRPLAAADVEIVDLAPASVRLTAPRGRRAAPPRRRASTRPAGRR